MGRTFSAQRVSQRSQTPASARMSRRRREEESFNTRLPINVLIVEDDDFQKLAVQLTLEAAGKRANVEVVCTIAATGSAALDEVRNASFDFDLVLMDYLLLGANGAGTRAASSHLPTIRSELGANKSIVMLSGDEQEVMLARCLALGADAYRLKPVTTEIALELLFYAEHKKQFLFKRQRQAHTRGDVQKGLGPPTHGDDAAGGAHWAPHEDPAERLIKKFSLMADSQSFAHGRRSPIQIGMVTVPREEASPLWQPSSTTSGPSWATSGVGATVSEACKRMVAIKVCHRASLRGPPPPPHRHVNAVLQQVSTGEKAFEVRELCDGGELFETLQVCLPRAFLAPS